MSKLSKIVNHLKHCAKYGLPYKLRALNVFHIILKG